MNWIELFLTLTSSPLIDHLSDEEIIELATFIQDHYLR